MDNLEHGVHERKRRVRRCEVCGCFAKTVIKVYVPKTSLVFDLAWEHQSCARRLGVNPR